jgi:hypothetical protein
MRHHRTIPFVLLFSTQLLAQTETGIVAGKVMLPNDEPAASAAVMLEGTKLGASTKEDGSFVIDDVPVGTYGVNVRLVGYEQTELPTVRVRAKDTVHVLITLRENEIEMSQILVTGTRRQEAKDTRPSVTTMTPRESKILPGAAEDVLRSLQALPGVTSVNDFSSQLVVRGSGPDQNIIMIDGFEVINPYRLYGLVSMFNPETVSDISLQTGGFEARYGDRLSAVIDVKNREGRIDVPFSAKLNFSLTNMNLIFEGGLPLEGASYLLSLRRTYYDLILGPVLKSKKLIEGDVALPNFRDLQFKSSIPITDKHKIVFNALTSRDGVSVVSGRERDRADSVSLVDEALNTMLGASWQFTPSKDLAINTQLSWYRNKGLGSFDGTFVDPSQNTGKIGREDTIGLRFVNFAVDYSYIYDKTSLAQRFVWNSAEHAIEAGYGVDFLRTDFTRYFEIDQRLKDFISQRGFVVPVSETQTVRFNRYHLFLQDRIAFDEKVFFQPGFLVDLYPFLKKKFYLAPRMNLSYKLNDISTVRAALGMYYQSPGMEKEDFRNRITFGDAAMASLDAERAIHYILGYDRMVNPSWQFKTETYYKDFSNVIVAEKLQGSRWSSTLTRQDSIFSPRSWSSPVRVPSDSLTSFPVNDATGRSYGFEVMLQKIRSQPTDKFTGWISYALSYALRDRDGKTTPFLFDQRHAMNVVANYRFAEKWDVGALFTLRSGRPYSEALGVKPRIIVGYLNGVEYPAIQTDKDGKVMLDVDYERDAFSGRMSLYHTLDVRVTTYPSWWGLNWSVYLDIQNVYNRENAQFVNYWIDEFGSLKKRITFGIPLFPSLGFSVNF